MRIKKSTFRMILLILAVGIVGYLALRGGGGEKQENEIVITAVYRGEENVTEKTDAAKVASLVGNAGISKSSKSYADEKVQWKIEFTMNGDNWVMVLGEEVNLMFNTAGDTYKIKNSGEIINSLEEYIE